MSTQLRRSPSFPLGPDLDQRLRVFKTLSSISDFAYTFDSQCRFLYANQALLDLLGLRLDQIVGRTFLDLPYPLDLALKLQAQIQRVFDTHEKLIDEAVYTNPAGRTGRYEYVFNPVFGRDGLVEVVAGSTREVTHRKINEEIQGRLAAIINSSNDAIVSKDLMGVVTSWNAAAERILGYTADEMVGTSILRLIPPELHYEEDQILSKIRVGQRIDHYETTRIRKNGERFDVSLTISPILNSSNTVIGTSKILRDISSRKHMETRLIQAEKIATMGRMAATIAHEVNNPLEAATNLIYLARTSSAGNQPAIEYLTMAEHELERIAHLTRQTLGYYRDTRARTSVVCQALIEEVLHVYQSKIQARNITVETIFDTIRPLYASKGELIQSLSNLIANAVDAMPNGGHLFIRVSELDANHLRILIRDSGIGIAPEDLPKVFQAFFTTKGNLGTGLGLWATKQHIENHGGQIAVSSSNVSPDTGTTVEVILPVSVRGRQETTGPAHPLYGQS